MSQNQLARQNLISHVESLGFTHIHGSLWEKGKVSAIFEDDSLEFFTLDTPEWTISASYNAPGEIISSMVAVASK